MPMIYLACHYAHPDVAVHEFRVREVDACAAAMMRDGHVVFSPLSMHHRVADHCDLHKAPHEFWMAQDLPWMAACDQLVVLCLDGWKESKGVQTEIVWATQHLKIPVIFIAPRSQDESTSDSRSPIITDPSSSESAAEGIPSGSAHGIVKLH